MKLLVLSDSHRNRTALERILNDNMDADRVIFLGDGEDDLEDCSYMFPWLSKKEIIQVSGNCDGWSMKPLTQIISVGDHKILCTHGHMQNVKRNYDELARSATEKGCDIALFGHTHFPYCSEKNGVKLFNPGAVMDGNYGVVMIDSSVRFEHLRV